MYSNLRSRWEQPGHRKRGRQVCRLSKRTCLPTPQREVVGGHQVVFFYLYPASGITADVYLVITSCHSREVAFSRIKQRFNIHTILRKCLHEAKRIP